MTLNNNYNNKEMASKEVI